MLVGGSPVISVQCASGVIRRLGQRWRESFWSPIVVPFQCLECPSDQTSEQYSRCGLTSALYRGTTVCMLLCVTVL